MKQSLHLKLSQSLTLTPQLQQSIRLLQLSTVELNQELDQFLSLNPFLERTDIEGDEPLTTAETTAADVAESRDSIDLSDFSLGSRSNGTGSGNGEDDDRDPFAQLAANEPTLAEHLLTQLQLTPLSARDKQLAAIVIAHLDEDGYLTLPLAELHAIIEAETPIDLDELSIALKQVQNFDPPGVAARDLAECLALQLSVLPTDTPHRNRALITVQNHLDLLANRDYARLKRLLKADEETLRGVRDLIVSLDPKPGRRFSQGDIRYVVPDVIVKKINNQWRVLLNREAVPRLRINKIYADLIARSRDANSKNLSAQLQEARWMMKNVQQRFDTIVRVTEAIVLRQRNFFEHGEVAMKPLVLREIADQVGLHESTISRVTTQKFMLTSRGLFELKYFFGSHVATDTGGACSSTAIRALIKQLVAAEDGKKPLSDHRISGLLAEQGIVVARRTVAKYREAMQIQPANLRKSI